MVRHPGRNRASSPAVSTLRPPRFKGTSRPPSQQTPPSAQRPPPSQQPLQQTPTVIPSSIPSQQQSQFDLPHDADPIEDFSEHEVEGAVTLNNANGSQNAFQVMASSQRSSGSQRFGGYGQPPKWSKEEDAVLIRGIREGWSATQIARELATRRTGSAIRGRKKALKEKFNLEEPATTGPRQLQVDSRRRWTPAEMSIIQQGVRDELGPTALQQKLKDRTIKSIEHKIKKRKLLSKDPVKSGDGRSAKKAKVDKPNVGETKNQTPPVSTVEGNGVDAAMVLDDTVQDDAGQETATPQDQTMADDVEEYPAYPDPPQQREAVNTTQEGDEPITNQEAEEPVTTQDQEEPVTFQTDEVEEMSVPMKADFDFSTVQTAFVKLPATANSGAKPGRLRKPTAAAKKSTPRRTARQVSGDVQNNSAPDEARAGSSEDAAAAEESTPGHAATRQARQNAQQKALDASADIRATAGSGRNAIPRQRPAAASTRSTRPASTRNVQEDVHEGAAQVEADFYDSDSDDIEAARPKPRAQPKGQVEAGFYSSDSDDVETSKAKPRTQRKGLFDDWTAEQRWQDCLRQSGGDEKAARRQLKETNLTAGMYDAILRKDQGAIESIRAERRQMELREAIEEGRARRIKPAPDAATIAGGEEADEEVLREEDWEIFIEKDDVWSLPSEDHDSDDGIEDEDDAISEDMIRDREFVEVEDEDEEEDLSREERGIQEVDDEDEEEEAIQYEVPPPPPTFAIPPPRHFTPIQVMQANVADDTVGLPTPAPTSEKLRAFGIDSKQPTSSVPTTAASTTAGSERSDSKRSRRRSRNANRRRESGSVRPARTKDAQMRRSVKSEAGPPPHRASSQALFSDDTENPFMNIVRNAHIPTPPKRTREPTRRRGSPSPPAWFEEDQESADESEEESD